MENYQSVNHRNHRLSCLEELKLKYSRQKYQQEPLTKRVNNYERYGENKHMLGQEYHRNKHLSLNKK